ncbi:MAG: molybdopterin molybdenumtransferase MoeA [Desulfobacteraceae bacterium 4572_35.1]|nr:MAG: molybdopterin molybdenumtransferase MoeA [Desulfobacteraceae bacterium 4572_35.1]
MSKSFIEARNIILENSHVLNSESVSLEDLGGRVIATDINAPLDLPRWDNSEMDGFAVRHADCHLLATLQITDYIPAGATATGITVRPGTAVKIMTGAPIPAGCDAIVPIENTIVKADLVTLNQAVELNDYIRFKGSDIGIGETIIPAKTVLRPAEINLLASFSCPQVPVIRRPIVAILSTGDELVAPGSKLNHGQVIDSNSYSLAVAVKEVGAIPQVLGIAHDNHSRLQEKIAIGLEADVLITSAGVSAGDRDLVRELLADAGVEQLFWKINIKPGGPTAFGCKGDTLVFSLPGNPVSSMIAFDQLVRPALLKMVGRNDILRSTLQATVKGTLVNETAKTRFLRVRVEQTSAGLVAESAGDQNTGIVRTMVKANALAILVPEQKKLKAGELVNVQFIG